MPDLPRSGWSGRVAVAVRHGEPPEVLVATDPEVLTRVIALRLVARTRPADLPAGALGAIREAILAGAWDVAVAEWSAAVGDPVDAYPDDEVWTEARVEAEQASFEIRLAPLFEGYDPAQPPAGNS